MCARLAGSAARQVRILPDAVLDETEADLGPGDDAPASLCASTAKSPARSDLFD